MARAAAQTADSQAASNRRLARYVFRAIGLLFLLCLAIYVFMEVEHFLISDYRFRLVGPREAGIDSGFQVTGLQNASTARVYDIFEPDFGRNIVLCPLSERRRQLLEVDWVEQATVSRVWPNRIHVALTERLPVAFAPVASGSGSTMPMLIDRHGVLLSPGRRMKLKLPVILGVRSADSDATRKQRVARFLSVRDNLGPLMDRISEVDVADLDNIKVTQELGGRAVIAMLGSQKFEQRMRNLLDNWTEINRRLPYATTLDLRLPDRVIAVAEELPKLAQAAPPEPAAPPPAVKPPTAKPSKTSKLTKKKERR
jgi:cell division protein FtsQ